MIIYSIIIIVKSHTTTLYSSSPMFFMLRVVNIRSNLKAIDLVGLMNWANIYMYTYITDTSEIQNRRGYIKIIRSALMLWWQMICRCYFGTIKFFYENEIDFNSSTLYSALKFDSIEQTSFILKITPILVRQTEIAFHLLQVRSYTFGSYCMYTVYAYICIW